MLIREHINMYKHPSFDLIKLSISSKIIYYGPGKWHSGTENRLKNPFEGSSSMLLDFAWGRHVLQYQQRELKLNLSCPVRFSATKVASNILIYRICLSVLHFYRI